MTLEEFYKATEGMSKDAKLVMITSKGNIIDIKIGSVKCDTKNNMIGIC